MPFRWRRPPLAIDVAIACSDVARLPQLLHFAASYRQGVSGLTFRAADPDHDIERYTWDLTACRGTSVLSGGLGLTHSSD